MKLSYGQIYITLQCGPASQCSELNVISFKVNSHHAFTSSALILGVLELAKGSDVITESVLLSVELRSLWDTNPSHCTLYEIVIRAFSFSATGCEHPRSCQGAHRVQGCQPSLWLTICRLFPSKHFLFSQGNDAAQNQSCNRRYQCCRLCHRLLRNQTFPSINTPPLQTDAKVWILHDSLANEH